MKWYDHHYIIRVQTNEFLALHYLHVCWSSAEYNFTPGSHRIKSAVRDVFPGDGEDGISKQVIGFTCWRRGWWNFWRPQ